MRWHGLLIDAVKMFTCLKTLILKSAYNLDVFFTERRQNGTSASLHGFHSQISHLVLCVIHNCNHEEWKIYINLTT